MYKIYYLCSAEQLVQLGKSLINWLVFFSFFNYVIIIQVGMWSRSLRVWKSPCQANLHFLFWRYSHVEVWIGKLCGMSEFIRWLLPMKYLGVLEYGCLTYEKKKKFLRMFRLIRWVLVHILNIFKYLYYDYVYMRTRFIKTLKLLDTINSKAVGYFFSKGMDCIK